MMNGLLTSLVDRPLDMRLKYSCLIIHIGRRLVGVFLFCIKNYVEKYKKSVYYAQVHACQVIKCTKYGY